MKLVTLDFETYYSKEFSLSRMTTEEYIRSPEFQTIGVAIKHGSAPARWYDFEYVEEGLATIDWDDTALLCHNTAFDGAILSWRYGRVPKMYLDTLSMARPTHNLTVGGSLKALATHYGIGEKGTEVVDALGKRAEDFSRVELAQYGRYCINDVELTYQLFGKLNGEHAGGFPKSELAHIDILLRMYCVPTFMLDKKLLQEHLAEVKEGKSGVLELVLDKANELEDAQLVTHISEALEEGKTLKDLLMSNDLFASLLRVAGVEPPMKISARTGKEAYAFAKTDKEFKALLEHENELVSALVAARLGVKTTIEETRTERFIALADRGPLPIMLNYYGAHTGRACLTGDTVITVLRGTIVLDILIPELRPDDFVWDGQAFVSHGGLVDQGVREVITYDGISGTPDHRVFCEEVEGEVELRVAAERGYALKIAGAPR